MAAVNIGLAWWPLQYASSLAVLQGMPEPHDLHRHQAPALRQGNEAQLARKCTLDLRPHHAARTEVGFISLCIALPGTL